MEIVRHDETVGVLYLNHVIFIQQSPESPHQQHSIHLPMTSNGE